MQGLCSLLDETPERRLGTCEECLAALHLSSVIDRVLGSQV